MTALQSHAALCAEIADLRQENGTLQREYQRACAEIGDMCQALECSREKCELLERDLAAARKQLAEMAPWGDALAATANELRADRDRLLAACQATIRYFRDLDDGFSPCIDCPECCPIPRRNILCAYHACGAATAQSKP